MTDTESTTKNTDNLTGWRKTLAESASLKDRAGKADKRAGTLLWDGSKVAVNEWLPGSDSDVSGEGLYNEVLDALGKPRKGDASKIRTVAVAVRTKGLVLDQYPSLGKAYKQALALTKTATEHKDEDKALTAAIATVAESAPKTAGTPESAARIVLAQGESKAAALLLDALGATDNAAHRAFVRAVAQEAGSRVAPKPKAVKKAAAPKKGAAVAPAKKAAAKKAPAKKGAAKKAAANAAPKKVAAPASSSKPKPTLSTTPVAAPPVPVTV